MEDSRQPHVEKSIRDGRSPFRGLGALSGAQPIYNVSASTGMADSVLKRQADPLRKPTF